IPPIDYLFAIVDQFLFFVERRIRLLQRVEPFQSPREFAEPEVRVGHAVHRPIVKARPLRELQQDLIVPQGLFIAARATIGLGPRPNSPRTCSPSSIASSALP